MPSTQPPLLLLDVDGPLNPYALQPGPVRPGYVSHRLRPGAPADAPPVDAGERSALRVDLNPEHGEALLALPFDLVWATTWMQEANRLIGPLIGLPELPFVDFLDDDVATPSPTAKLHWKTATLAAYAGDRPFAWVDDELARADRRWLARNHAAPTLAHHVDPKVGLVPKDFARLAKWAAKL
ncbi:hypothetical protein [Yinghuangia seranimata]|uniref:hypothetical protein n=1 Tax=Yinghuangia seranimata TaxID=408067 RepID=UPI00248BEE41|nr:hypothetical protein [Yinghuangia seranimata]MDI2129760.1 hypothetical protein [Yinghuangia seranimata]